MEVECNKAAQGATDRCAVHGGGKRCVEQKCKKIASGNTKFCKAHGGGRRCIEADCTKSASGKTDRCKAHGGGIRCIEPYCKKSATDSLGKCIEHGGGKRCPNCITWPDSRSGKAKYDGYCATCFKRVFPDDERSKMVYTHTKEIRVRNEINKYNEGFIHNIPLYTGNCDCTHRRRIDHRKLIGNTLLCIETDEFAHRAYNKIDEEIRYDDLYMVHSGKWIFIRFNPDGKGVDMDDKLSALMDEIKLQIERIYADNNTDLVEIIKMYY
jgi:hypothetical protein